MSIALLPVAVPPAPTFDEGRIPGNKGIWVGIFCVLVEFLLFFGVYFVARAHYPEAFRSGPDKLATVAGTAITVLLLSSGYCVVKALAAMRRERTRATLGWLLLGMLLGLGYPLVKFFEFRWNIAQGIDGAAGIFYTVYYYLTLNHLVHVSWGLLGLGWVAVRTALGHYTAADHAGLEAAAVYWHTTDVIWLIIFPFFYVWR